MKTIKLLLTLFAIMICCSISYGQSKESTLVKDKENIEISTSSEYEHLSKQCCDNWDCYGCSVPPPPPPPCYIPGHWAVWGGIPYWVSGHYVTCD